VPLRVDVVLSSLKGRPGTGDHPVELRIASGRKSLLLKRTLAEGSWREALRNTWTALPALFLPVLIVGGIHSGAFTPTEASIVAVAYALVIGMGLYRTLTVAMLPSILLRTALLTASVMLIVAASACFAWVLTIAQVPQSLARWIIGLGLDPLTFLIAVNVLLLLFGIFIEPLPGVMILVPILAPMAAALGIDPVHFAIVVIVNLTMGMITPPVGGLLFVTALVARIPVSGVIRELWPMMGVLLVACLGIHGVYRYWGFCQPKPWGRLFVR
jgi:tripartite ATP-independent transporter DctM subunit